MQKENYCINIYERQDNYISAKKQFKKHNIDVNFIRNHKHSKGGRYGCFDSHIQCVKDGYNKGLDYIVVFEDDFKIKGDYNEIIENCERLMRHENVEIIYLQSHGVLYLTNENTHFYGGKSSGTLNLIITRQMMKKI